MNPPEDVIGMKGRFMVLSPFRTISVHLEQTPLPMKYKVPSLPPDIISPFVSLHWILLSEYLSHSISPRHNQLNMSVPSATVNPTTASDRNTNTDAASAALTAADSDVAGGQSISTSGTGTAMSQGTVVTFHIGNNGKRLAFYPNGQHDLVVANRDSLSGIWAYMQNTSLVKFTDKKTKEDWKEKGQKPLLSALKAFEEAIQELYTGPAPYSYKIQNNFKLKITYYTSAPYISAQDEGTMRKLWNAYVAYQQLGFPFTDIGNPRAGMAGKDYDVWEMKYQCARELCWAARGRMYKVVNDIAPGTLDWTEKPGKRNWKVDWISSWLPDSAPAVLRDFTPSVNDVPELDDGETLAGSGSELD
jgi:hypothetical protein